MAEYKVNKNQIYFVTAPQECTLTDENGVEFKTIEANSQTIVLMPTEKITTSCDNVTFNRPFDKAALEIAMMHFMSGTELAPWCAYMLEKAALTGNTENTAMVKRAWTEYEADETAPLPNRMIEDYNNLREYEMLLDATFWTSYFEKLKEE